jgi:NAD(P)-dependent dehydrogenase (short-subunit alcohol dehydrogenase family)
LSSASEESLGLTEGDAEVNMSLTERWALVTGGGRGIGRAVALSFAREGAAVAALARTKDEVRSVASEITTLGRPGLPLVADVTQREGNDWAVNACLREFPRLDFVVNSAGVCRVRDLEATTDGIWDQHLAVNLTGAFLLTRAVYPYMRDHGGGWIINIASEGNPTRRPTVRRSLV